MCPNCPQSQPCSRLHQKKCGKQVKEDDPAPLLCTDETSAGVLVESSVQERNGPVFFNSSGKALEQVDEIAPSLKNQARQALSNLIYL